MTVGFVPSRELSGRQTPHSLDPSGRKIDEPRSTYVGDSGRWHVRGMGEKMRTVQEQDIGKGTEVKELTHSAPKLLTVVHQ